GKRMMCRFCGQEAAANSRFCTKCGAPLAAHGSPSSSISPPMEVPTTSGKAVASLVCGCLFFAFPVPIVAIVLGHKALSEISRSAGRLKGEAIAILGMVLGYVGAVFVPVVLILAAVVIPNLFQPPVAPNDADALDVLDQYNQAAKTYGQRCPDRGYPA